MEIGTVKQVDIQEEMKAAYLDYAMSVITARALPDVRDGLKPVQRRILYAINDMGLRHDKPYKKSARIVGEVLGKYHPHGDAAVYDAMVRMAQDFSMRYMLVDGQGNFGSTDGDNAAAMRYTEARLAAISDELLADIDKETVDFVDNFDGSLQEPHILPARLPNLLLNGASGIAVGMATNVPPHNLGEICDAISFLADKQRRIDSVSVDDLMSFVKGPDFPTGGTILGLEGIRSAYATGKGRIVVRAKTHFEDARGGKSLIIVTELPYQVGKASLIEKIASLAREKRLDTISDLRDESDRQGTRIVIELKRGESPRPTLMQLYKYTSMQSAFNVNMLALVDGEPRVLSLKRYLQLFIDHRREVIKRRTQFELERAKRRAHILEGLRTALDDLDAVIATIRKSRTADTALTNLKKRFKLTEIQARAILDLQLRRLAALERRRIEEEYADALKQIKYLKGLLSSSRKILSLVKSELQELRSQYGDVRRTRIVEKEAEEIGAEDVIPEKAVFIAVSQTGYVKRCSAKPYRVQRGDALALSRKRDAVENLVATNTLHRVLFCTNRGRCCTVKAHQIPNSAQQGAGIPLSSLLGLQADETVTSVLDVPDSAQPWFLTMCTAQGKVKRTAIEEFAAIRPSGLAAITLNEGDELRWSKLTSGNDELIFVTAGGQTLRFREGDVRAMGRSAAGVNAIKLASGDHLVSMNVVQEGGSLLVVSERGFAKRTSLAAYPTHSRYSRGVTTFATRGLSQTGRLAAACVVQEDDDIAIRSAGGAILYTKAAETPTQTRSTRGKAIISLKDTEVVASVTRLAAKPPARPSTSKRTTTGGRRTASSRRSSPAAKKATRPSRKRATTRQTRSRKKPSKQ
jgi:DNA gyrase subunit A